MGGMARSVLLHYGGALLLTALAVAVRFLLDPWLDNHLPLTTVYGAVALSVWFSGSRPAVVVVVLGYLACDWLFIEPRGSFGRESARTWIGFFAYLLSCTIIISFGQAMRSARAKAEASRDLLKKEAAQSGAAEERFRLAADAVNGIIYELDFQTGHVERTRGLYEVLGYRPDEVPPNAAWWGEQIHPEDLQRVIGIDPNLARATNDPVTYRVRHKDGRWLHVEDRAVLIKDDAGKPVKLVGCTVDVTARKNAENALRVSEERLRLAVENTGLGWWDMDLTGGPLIWSPTHFTLLGLAPTADGTATVSLWSERIHPEDQERVLAAFARAKQDKALYSESYRIVRANDGETRWLTASGRFLYDGDGRAVRSVGIVSDETERRLAEERVQTSEEQYRFLVNAVPSLVWSSRPDGTTDFHNDRWFAYTGLSRDSQTAADLLGVCHPDDVAGAIERWTQAVRTGEPYRAEYRLRRGGDGEYRWWQAEAMPMRDREGRIVRWFGTCTDIHDAKRVQNELRERETFIRGVLGSITDAFFAVSKDWRFTFVNDEIARRFELRRDEIVGRRVWELFPNAVGSVAYVQLHRAMADRVAVEYETYYEPWQKWFLDRAFPTDDGGLAIYSREVTEQRRAGDALRQSEARLRRVFESNVVGMIRWDLDRGLILDANAEFLRMTGFTREDVEAGRLNFRDMTPAEWTPRNEEGIRAIRAEGHASPYEKEYIRRDGSRVPLIIAGTRFEDSPSEGMSLVLDITERKQAEQEIARLAAESDRQRRLYETILTNTPDFMYVFSLDRKVIYANDALIQMWGRGREGAIGKTFLEIGYEPWHAEMHDREIDQVRATKQPIRGEVPFKGTLGRRIYDYIFVPVLGADGEVEAVAGTTRDVTERKESEERLRASEERSAFVRRSSGVGFWYCDLPFDVLQWDELVKAHFHLLPDAVVTIQTFYDRIHPDDREPTRRAIEESIAGRGPYDVDYRTVDPDTGAVKWVRAIGRTFYDADGAPTRFDGVSLDVSKQKRAELSLRESEERFRLMADAAPVMIWMSGTDKLVSWYNQPWLDFTGRSMEDVVGIGVTEVVHPDDVGRTLPLYAAAFDARAPFSMEYRLRRRDGEYRWLICNGVPRYRSDGEFEGYIGSCFDVTDYKNAQAALREADQKKDEFLATLAHELRNPLAPLRNGVQIIKLAADDSQAVEKARSIMERQVVQMARLIDDLMDLSRISRGKIVLRTTRLRLADVVKDAVDTARPLIEERGHTLTLDVPLEPIEVDADGTRLAQVFGNLLNNAAMYTDRGGRIRLAIERQGSDAVVTVEDNGIGIPAHMLPQVFEMFTQVDRSLEKSQGGLGIGLNIVKRLVEKHGGSVEAQSSGAGQGSRFVVRLPVAMTAAAQADGPDREHEPKIGQATRRRILVVDDNVDGACVLTEMLSIMGNEARTAHDGLQALNMAADFRPDVILMDIGMPKLNGYEACRRIREQPWGKNIILIAQTGWGQEDDKRKSHDAGFNFHMVKPVDPAALENLLAGLLTTAG